MSVFRTNYCIDKNAQNGYTVAMDTAIEKKTYIYNKKTGRPTKYLQSVINPKVAEYLDQCGREQTKLPTIEGLANYLEVAPSTVYEWITDHKEFSENIKRLASQQKDQLINDGMYGGREINASMAIFLLKAIHGLKENDPNTLVQVNIKPILGNLDPA